MVPPVLSFRAEPPQVAWSRNHRRPGKGTRPSFGNPAIPRLAASRLARNDSRQLIQLVPASRFHFVVIFFDCVQNSMDPRPVMSPTPKRDSFHPPNENGSRGTGTPTFTPTIPALAFSITRRATPPLSVNTDAAFP